MTAQLKSPRSEALHGTGETTSRVDSESRLVWSRWGLVAVSVVVGVVVGIAVVANWSTADATPQPVRLTLSEDLPVPHAKITDVPDLSYTINETGWYVVEAHMDWPISSQGGMRRMDIRLDNGGFVGRIAAMNQAPGSRDGYTHTSSGPIWLEAGDKIVTQVRQKSRSDTVLQATGVTWVVIYPWTGG